jgi:WD40 repeat protein/DNA-binding SARP family transcriptional activator
LGRLEIYGSDGRPILVPGPARRQLLAALISRRGAATSASALIEDLWGMAPPRSAVNSLRSHIVRLRAALDQAGEQQRLTTEGDGYRLRLEPDEVDAGRFERLVSEASRAPDRDAAIAYYDEALALWRDEAYVEFGDASFAVLERIRLGEQRALAREQRTDLALGAGLTSELIPELEQRVRLEPYRERGWEQLALALYRAGRQVDGLTACRRARQVLAEDLGLDPGSDLTRLEQQMLQHDDDLLISVPARVVQGPKQPHCPYVGLRGYRERDAALFVGRERLASAVAGRLADQSVVVVTGASGVGKSSLVRAGLLPALRAGALPGSSAWRIEVRTPAGGRMAPSKAKTPDLVVLDQAEEMYTTIDDDARENLLDDLADFVDAQDGRLLLVVRSDFYGRLAETPSIAAFAEKATMLVAPMRGDDLRRALVLPATASGLQLEGDLIEAVMEDAGGQAEVMPLLSEVMRRTWQRREGDVLTLAGYRAAGELAGAVEAAAEDCYGRLTEEQQLAARRLLVRMAARTDSGWARRPLIRTDSPDAAEQSALDALIAARLVVADERRVEVAHEALFNHWPRLQSWLAERSLAADMLLHLDQAVADWHAAGLQDADLYRGPRLAAAMEWREEHPQDLTTSEGQFLDASAHAAEAELHAARERAEREARGRRRLRLVAAGLAVVLVGAVGATVVARHERSKADHAATVALANGLGGEAISEPNLDVAMLLAAAGEKLNPSEQTQGALLRTVLRAPSALTIFHGINQRVSSLALSPDGRSLALEDNVPNVFMLNATTGRETTEIPDSQLNSANSQIAFTQDGSLLFFGGGAAPRDLELIDPATGNVSKALLFPKRVLQAVQAATDAGAGQVGPPDYGGGNFAFAHGGARVATDIAGEVMQWNLPQGTLAAPPFAVAHQNQDASVFYEPDGHQLVMIGPDYTTLVDASTGRALRTYHGGGSNAALSPDGKILANGQDDGSINFRTLATGALVTVPNAHQGAISNVDFTPDGKHVITSGVDALSRMWDVGTHQLVQTFTGHTGRIVGQAISPDGSTLYTGSYDGTILAWDITGTRGFIRSYAGVPAGGQNAWSFAFSPDSRYAAISGSEGIVSIWDLRQWRQVRSFRAVDSGGFVGTLSFSRDGHSLLVAGDPGPPSYSGDASLRVWALNPSPHPVLSLHGLWNYGWASYSPDGKVIAAVGSPADAPGFFSDRGVGDGLAAEWDASTGRQLGTTLRLHGGGAAIEAGFAPHGTELALGQLGNHAAVVDPARGKVLSRWASASAQYLVSTAMSPDGTRIATADFDGYVSIWDTNTHRLVMPKIKVSTDVANEVKWSPDGTRLVTTGDDGAVAIWDAKTGAQIGTSVMIPSLSFGGAAFSPDGQMIGAGDVTGHVWIYPATAQGWISYACSLANRNLTRTEWAQYLPGHKFEQLCPER